MHGMACSRLDAAYFHEVGLQLNARIIGVDRPGMGLSSPQPKRTLLGLAQDVEHLTDHLGLAKFSIMVGPLSISAMVANMQQGMSGGGPSTLACAKALPPSKLKAVAMVVALGPPDIGMSGAQLINRIAYPYGLRYCPALFHRWFWRRDAIGRVDLSDEKRLDMLLLQIEKSRPTMSEKDQIAMSDIGFHRLALKSTRQGFVQGYDGVLLDGKLCCFPFGFKVEDIRSDLPVFLWYGKQDVLVPPNHGIQLAKRLSNRADLRLKDETHVSLTINWKTDIIESLVKDM